jgi:hypothetical protein
MGTTVGEEQRQEQQNDSNDGLRPRIEELKDRISALNHRAQAFIKEHPAACLMGALGLGYLFARIARRRG